MKKVLIFGACGSIGNYIYTQFVSKKYTVIGTTTNSAKNSEHILYVTNDMLDNLNSIDNIDIVIWAHGHNFNDNIENFNFVNFKSMVDGNISFILNTLQFLMRKGNINNNAKMVIISSIWENFSRENKLSYSITKSALSGLVKNVAFELSKKNILINNVLPGVIDNEMSQKTLSTEQFLYIKNYMNFNRLITVDDVYNTVDFLVTNNSGITGQSISVDLGFTSLRKYN